MRCALNASSGVITPATAAARCSALRSARLHQIKLQGRAARELLIGAQKQPAGGKILHLAGEGGVRRADMRGYAARPHARVLALRFSSRHGTQAYLAAKASERKMRTLAPALRGMRLRFAAIPSLGTWFRRRSKPIPYSTGPEGLSKSRCPGIQ